MARITGLEKSEGPGHLHWYYTMMRRMFGKDLTPAKIQMRRPGIVWCGVDMEGGLAKKRSDVHSKRAPDARCRAHLAGLDITQQFCRWRKGGIERRKITWARTSAISMKSNAW